MQQFSTRKIKTGMYTIYIYVQHDWAEIVGLRSFTSQTLRSSLSQIWATSTGIQFKHFYQLRVVQLLHCWVSMINIWMSQIAYDVRWTRPTWQVHTRMCIWANAWVHSITFCKRRGGYILGSAHFVQCTKLNTHPLTVRTRIIQENVIVQNIPHNISIRVLQSKKSACHNKLNSVFTCCVKYNHKQSTPDIFTL